MARYGEAVVRRVRAINVATGLPVTGDTANIDLYVAEDNGAPVAVTNALSEDGYGYYRVQLTAAENTCWSANLSGESSTGNVVIVGCQWDNEATAAAIADAVWDEDPSDHDAAGKAGEALLDAVAGTAINGEVANSTANTRALLDSDEETTRATLTYVEDGDEITATRS